MSWKAFVQDYLTFTKKDRIGAICVLLIVSSLYLLPKLFSGDSQNLAIRTDSSLLQQIAEKSIVTSESESENVSNSFYEPTVNSPFKEGTLFSFDPNTLAAEGWRKLGLPERTIKTIHNYRSKGGKFYRKEDLNKIWGLPTAFYERVEPYIEIEPAPRQTFTYDYKPSTPYTSLKGKRSISAVQVNIADTSELILLPGIGSKLAARIVAFRDKLGGFHSNEQIGETYGLPDSTFQMLKLYLQVDASAVKKMNLNTATKEELRMHPYIKWALANAIVAYRTQHGAFKSIEELKNIMLIDETTFQKIAPYFTL